ncbi:MAG TPA: DUF3455 domain-containing protein, partial [Burkholderiaceae bacterium]|nr:DUF3455 domain-containing protein [Burkholderiaceae bacterium]
RLAPLSLTFLAASLAACGSMSGRGSMPMAAPFSQEALPDTVKVPAGHRVAWETVGVGEITYECRAKAGAADAFEWVFVGPKADLRSRQGQVVGSYFGPPATWAAQDGSSLTGAQLAVAPAGSGNIPLQLVKANPAKLVDGKGDLQGVSYIQRVATRGGVAPALACGSGSLGQRQVVTYQADYIFWKPA